MKGIITKYFDKKGFGFIKDQDENLRFFHISSVIERNKFLSNLPEYTYDESGDETCKVISFKATENEKGLQAINIMLTNQIFNDQNEKTAYEAMIIDIKYEVQTIRRIATGFSKSMSAPLNATAGGNGTYRIGYPEVIKELNIYYRRVDDIGWGAIEVRELALKVNERTNITDAFLNALKDELIGKTIKIIPNSNGAVLMNNSILEI